MTAVHPVKNINNEIRFNNTYYEYIYLHYYYVLSNVLFYIAYYIYFLCYEPNAFPSVECHTVAGVPNLLSLNPIPLGSDSMMLTA